MGARVEVPTVFARDRLSAKQLARRLASGSFREGDDGLEKRCHKCREYLPADNTEFYPTNATRDGLYRWCKVCYVEWREERRKRLLAAPVSPAQPVERRARKQKPRSQAKRIPRARVRGGAHELSVDQGQRFEVRYRDGIGESHVWGWTDEVNTARRCVRDIAKNPAFSKPRIVDRQKRAMHYASKESRP